jgi:hypothetical protein
MLNIINKNLEKVYSPITLKYLLISCISHTNKIGENQNEKHIFYNNFRYNINC